MSSKFDRERINHVEDRRRVVERKVQDAGSEVELESTKSFVELAPEKRETEVSFYC